jgi:hypothetical protein
VDGNRRIDPQKLVLDNNHPIMALSSRASHEENDSMRIQIRDLAEADGRVLAGALSGRKLLAKLVERTGEEPATPEPVFLDFDGVEVATASFLRETVLAFRDTVRGRRSNFYPVVANASDLVADELRVLVAARGDVLMLCTLDEDGKADQQRLVGELDPKQRVTFDLVQQRGETGAAELMREFGESEKTTFQTAWNNRLAALASLGLVVELSQGRSKRYRPLFMEG